MLQRPGIYGPSLCASPEKKPASLLNLTITQDAIMAAWNGIGLYNICNLYNFIPTRLVSVTEKHGKMISY